MCKINILYSVEQIKTAHFTEFVDIQGLCTELTFSKTFYEHFTYYDHFFMLESLFRAWRYCRPLTRFSRPAPLVVTKAGRHFSAPGTESVPFLSGGCSSSASHSWRRFLVSLWVSARCSEQVQLCLSWMICFLMESIWVFWKSTTKEKRNMLNKSTV